MSEKKENGKRTEEPQVKSIYIPPINQAMMDVVIVGDTELIVHAWSDKAKRMMLANQQKEAGTKVKTPREKKDPEADYQGGFYWTPDGKPAFPDYGIKAAMIGACRQVEGLPMTRAKQLIRVHGGMLEIHGKPYRREDMVRLESGVADIRYRPAWPNWWIEVPLGFDADQLSAQAVVNLLNRAGISGLGEWRPSSPKSNSGTYGCFHVATEEEKRKLGD